MKLLAWKRSDRATKRWLVCVGSLECSLACAQSIPRIICIMTLSVPERNISLLKSLITVWSAACLLVPMKITAVCYHCMYCHTACKQIVVLVQRRIGLQTSISMYKAPQKSIIQFWTKWLLHIWQLLKFRSKPWNDLKMTNSNTNMISPFWVKKQRCYFKWLPDIWACDTLVIFSL